MSQQNTSAQSPKPARIEEAWFLYLNLLQIKKKANKNQKALYLKVKKLPSEQNMIYIQSYGYKPTIFIAMPFGI